MNKEMHELLSKCVGYTFGSDDCKKIENYITSLENQLDFVKEQNKYINQLEEKIKKLSIDKANLKEKGD